MGSASIVPSRGSSCFFACGGKRPAPARHVGRRRRCVYRVGVVGVGALLAGGGGVATTHRRALVTRRCDARVGVVCVGAVTPRDAAPQ